MKIKTNTLTDQALDWAVHTALGLSEEEFVVMDNLYGPQWRGPEYSTSWLEGGPIIEQEGVELQCWRAGRRIDHWTAVLPGQVSDEGDPIWDGPTPLIAAMRCFVASRLGESVEVPDELMEGGRSDGN